MAPVGYSGESGARLQARWCLRVLRAPGEANATHRPGRSGYRPRRRRGPGPGDSSLKTLLESDAVSNGAWRTRAVR